MLEQDIPITIDPNHSALTFIDVHTMFAENSYGKSLSEKTRWDEYKPSGMTNEMWTKHLGVDADNLRHMPLTYGIARQFIRHCHEDPSAHEEARFGKDEQRLLLLTAIVHDWPEAITGDIMFFRKTESDESYELAAFENMLADVIPGAQQEHLIPVIQQVIETILKDRSSKLGRAFNAIERIGYLRTGLTAFDKKNDQDSALENCFGWLASNVVSYQIPKLVEYAEMYPAVCEFITANQERITRCFEETETTIFDNYTDDERQAKIDLFMNTKTVWERSVFRQTHQALT